MQSFKWLFVSILIAGTLIAMSFTAGNCGDIAPQVPAFLLAPTGNIPPAPADPTGSRRFATTTIRRQLSLTGFWDFVADPDKEGEPQGYQRKFPDPQARQWVPGSWNSVARFWNYQGDGWYRTIFSLEDEGSYRLHFGAVGLRATVWLDGKLLGSHDGGYTPFRFFLPQLKVGKHQLVVRVCNETSSTTVPKENGGWFPFGGIYRPVYLERVDQVHVDDFFIRTRLLQGGDALLQVSAQLRNATGREVTEKLEFFIDGRRVHNLSQKITPGISSVTFELRMEQPELWSPDSPNLYMARLALGQRDDQFDRFGIKQIQTEGNRILLNGERFKLKGVNRHSDHPDWGPAIPPALIRQDLEIIKRMGANAVRHHYSPSEMFLDFCDEYGLVMMDEVPAWQLDARQLANPAVQQSIKDQFAAMVAKEINHPCIFSWSLGNEWGGGLNKDGETTETEMAGVEQVLDDLVAFARGVDSTHLLTVVNTKLVTEQAERWVDFICVNWAFFRWYGGGPELQMEGTAQEVAYLEEIHNRFPDMPIVLTEFGGSGSQAGWSNWGNAKWSEQFQARNVYESARVGLATEWLSGGCVWQLFDQRESLHRMLGPRLRGWNVKGILDCYRNPKMSYYNLQRAFNEFFPASQPEATGNR